MSNKKRTSEVFSLLREKKGADHIICDAKIDKISAHKSGAGTPFFKIHFDVINVCLGDQKIDNQTWEEINLYITKNTTLQVEGFLKKLGCKDPSAKTLLGTELIGKETQLKVYYSEPKNEVKVDLYAPATDLTEDEMLLILNELDK